MGISWQVVRGQEYFKNLVDSNFKINFENGNFEKVARNLFLINVLYGHLNVLYGDQIRR